MVEGSPNPGPWLPVLLAQDRKGLVCWPWREVACLRVELKGRLEATSAAGEVAHRPGPAPVGCPLAEVAPGMWLNGAWVTRTAEGVHLPDGRTLPLDGEPPPPLPDKPMERLPGTDLPMSSVLYLEPRVAVTAEGRVALSPQVYREALKHPHLAKAGVRHVNLLRLRRLGPDALVLDDGTRLEMARKGEKVLARRLGVPDLSGFDVPDDDVRLLFVLGLEELAWPLEEAPPERLERFRDDPVGLMANLLWQGRGRTRGAEEFLEEVVRPVARRAGVGWADPGPPAGDAPLEVQMRRLASASDSEALLEGAEAALVRFRPRGLPREMEDPLLHHFRAVLHAMVAELGIISFADLGWERGDGFQPGTSRAGTVVFAESSILEPGLREAREALGVSTLALGCEPPAGAVEALLDHLGGGPVQVVGHCSFTPRGWDLVEGFCRLLRRRGMDVQLAGHLARPGRFRPAEHRALGFHESANPIAERRRRAAWREQHGDVPCFHAASLERVVEALEEELAGLPPTAPGDDGPLRRPGVVLAEDPRGLVVLRSEEVVDVRPEAWGRVEVTTASGALAWAPGPAFLPRPPAPGVHRNLGLPLDAVVGLVTDKPQVWWETDGGRMHAGWTAAEAVGAHPNLVRIGFDHVNLRRVLRVNRRSLEMDTGESRPLWGQAPAHVARDLGLDDLWGLPGTTPQQRALLREGLRDWPGPLFPGVPRELTRSGGAPGPRPLVANLVWRLVRSGREGPEADWGRTARSLFYRFTAPALAEAGFRDPPREAEPGWSAWFDREGDVAEDPDYLLLEDVLTRFVGHDRICDYEALGFLDPRPQFRRLGTERPEVVVLFEKVGFAAEAAEFHSRFGVTTYTSGGMPRLVSTEWLAKDLLRGGIREVEVVTVADWDPGGDAAGTTLAGHLERYGVQVAGPVRPVVTPGRFTARELQFLSYALQAPTAIQEAVIRNWVKRTGGIGGEARGIHCDHLRPLERLIQAFLEVVGW